ncbi:DUF4124 domain-containing protein [Pseudomonas sp. N040]|uniref:DUF4124 domain-containing protein n=1 Tax=Pseudomonas sp. N040 TaxID=2785325 RepID=UPI0018A3039A|nr:DUF4124 domain-containing protein [Pseudomonas sp. N040]MBF7730133.1 DUF4124 domain-containing protein [Pseudomonas sp. N040]MBW7013775.1 DUF4124 domain-containing protein [Pseudomonas sp. N040]
MLTRLPRLLVLLPFGCAGLFMFLQPAVAAPVYQWKDASGQTVFSDQPPPAGVAAEQLTMPAPPSAADVEASQQRTKAMQQQADQLSAERRQREQRAAEAAKQAAAQQPEEPEEPEQNTYYDPQAYYPDRQPISRPRPPRGDLPVRPAQPIVIPGGARR